MYYAHCEPLIPDGIGEKGAAISMIAFKLMIEILTLSFQGK